MEKINIMIADDHELFIEGMKTMLEPQSALEIKATANDGEEVLRKLKSYYIDILLLDIQMPKMNGIETARQIQLKHPETKIIVLSMHNEKAFIEKMYQYGVSGYLLKNCNKLELLNAINVVHSGNKYFSTETTLVLLGNKKAEKVSGIIEDHLSAREKEILTLIAREENNSEIAEYLHISIHTVNTHRKNLLLKLGVKNTAGLVAYAIRNNMIN